MKLDFTDIIDLTHRIEERMPHWPGDPLTQIRNVASVAQDGYRLNVLTMGEHSGTHIGAPLHFRTNAASVDEIPVRHLVSPGVKIDISQNAQSDADALLQINDIEAWEARNGRIPVETILLVQTGWSRFWTNPKRYLGLKNKTLHFPGIAPKAAQLLLEERGIRGLGIDTHGVDGGCSQNFEVNTQLAKRNGFHLENLTNLNQLHETDFILVIGVLPIKRGTGAPCRVLALQ